MMLVHASLIFMNAAAGGRRSCLSGVNTCPDITYYAAVVPLFRAVLLSLRHEICFHVDRFCVAGAGSCRHISAPAAHHALSSACGGDVLSQFAACLQMASRAQISRSVHTQFPRGPQHTAARQDSGFVSAVAHVASLCGADIRLLVAACRHACSCPGRELLYLVVQDAAQCRLRAFLQLPYLLPSVLLCRCSALVPVVSLSA